MASITQGSRKSRALDVSLKLALFSLPDDFIN